MQHVVSDCWQQNIALPGAGGRFHASINIMWQEHPAFSNPFYAIWWLNECFSLQYNMIMKRIQKVMIMQKH